MDTEKRQERASQDESHQPQALFAPEILEAILLELPLLTSAQLVGRAWGSAIKPSKVHSKTFFFIAEPEATSKEPRFNTLLQEAFPPWFDLEGGRFYRGKPFTDLKWSKGDEKRKPFMCKEASWRCMLPMQPPPHALEIDRSSHYMRSSRRWIGQKLFRDGVRMAVLYDYSYATAAAPVSSFAMDWHVPMDADRDGDATLSEVVTYAHEKKKDVVTMDLSWTAQCRMGMPPDVATEFKSEAFKQKDIKFKMREREASR